MSTFVDSPAGYNAFPISCADASGNISKLFSTLHLADAVSSVDLRKDGLAFSTGASFTSNDTGTYLDTLGSHPTICEKSTVHLGSADYELTIPAKVTVSNDLTAYSLSITNDGYTNVYTSASSSSYSADASNSILLDYASHPLIQMTTSSSRSGGLQISDASGQGLELFTEQATCRLYAGAGGLVVGQKGSDNSLIATMMTSDASGNIFFGTDVSTGSKFTSSGTVDLVNSTTTVRTAGTESNDNTVASTAFVKSVAFDVDADHTWGGVQTFNKPLVASWAYDSGSFSNLGYSGRSTMATFPPPSDNTTIFTSVETGVAGTYMVHLNCTFSLQIGSQIKSISCSLRDATDGAVLFNARSFYPNVVSGNSEVLPVSLSASGTGYHSGDIYGVVNVIGATGVTVVYSDFLINLTVTRLF
jgi:hypothetical protein